MNKLIIYLSVLVVFLMTACDDNLELQPNDGLSDDQLFSTTEGFQNAILGVYGGFRSNGYYGEDRGIMICPDVLSDNVSFNVAGRQTQRSLFEWRNTAVDESFELYQRGYKIISRCNRILDHIDNLEDGAIKNNIKGEALATRALVYFDIARTYCKIPTQSSDALSSLGIPYLEDFEPEINVRRVGTTVEGVYTKILADLEEAVGLISEEVSSGHISKATVYGLLAKVNLYMGNWDAVITNADKVSGFAVAPYDEFKNIWLDSYESNILFKIKVTDQDDTRPGVVYNQEASGEIRSEYVCSYELRQLFKKGTGDVRLAVSTSVSDFDDHLYSHVVKYLGRAVGNKTVVDGKYLRYEDILLSKAEAQYNKGADYYADALATLDLLRDNRYTSYTGGETGEDLFNAIQTERRLELAFEGDRFYQLKRLGLPMHRTADGEQLVIAEDGTETSAGTAPVVQDVAASDHRWQLPIPQGAFDANPELTSDDQNPGYNN